MRVEVPLPLQTQDSDACAKDDIGRALEIWEGFASDPVIRRYASSGGLITALSLYCLEKEEFAFVLHAASDETRPWLNCTRQSRTRSELLARTGSRYAPASPCDNLHAIETSTSPCVFIGKPCDVAAVNMLRQQKPALDRNLGLILGFFCAGVPSTQGTLDLLETLHIRPENVKSLRYRGMGWPGSFQATTHDSNGAEPNIPYQEAWGMLTHYRPLRCNLCPDGLGRLADISCGDAWHHLSAANPDLGQSIVIVRTERGRQILNGAMKAGYVTLSRVGAKSVLLAQESLLQRRRELFGRLFAMRLFRMPTPEFTGFSLFRSWMRTSARTKLRTVLGTVKRILKRRWYKARRPSQTTLQTKSCASYKN